MKPSSQISKSYLTLGYTLLFSLSLAFCQPKACAAGANEADVPAADIAVLENRFFSHGYSHDPLEKRLERLECMIYGGVQDGSNLGRLNKMKRTVAERSATPLKAETAPAAPPGETAKAPASAQYPVLNTLEWRALKKTFPGESLDQRLERIETKLFGLPAPSMAYIDRVDRLKKTLGIDLPQSSGPVIAGGPMPKARPRPQIPNTVPFGSGQFEENFLNVPNGMGFPEMSFGFGFHSDIVNHVNQMFADMNKQMANLTRLGPGSWSYDPKQGVWIEMNTGRKVKPGQQTMELLPEDGTAPQARKSVPPKSAPNRPALPRFNTPSDLPAYSDPNAI